MRGHRLLCRCSSETLLPQAGDHHGGREDSDQDQPAVRGPRVLGVRGQQRYLGCPHLEWEAHLRSHQQGAGEHVHYRTAARLFREHPIKL